MTQQQATGAPGGAHGRIEAVEVGGRWYVRRCETPFWGEGATLSEAHVDLQRREGDYDAFLARAGIPPIPVTALRRWGAGIVRPVGRTILALALFSLFLVPVSYAISSGIGRGIKQAEIKIGGQEFWAAVDQRVMELSEAKYDLPPEQAERLRLALQRIVARFRPFVSEIGQVFVPMEPPVAAAEKK